MRIAIFGSGGVGGYFGGKLAASGQDVVFIARGEHLAALRTNGLRIEGTDAVLNLDHVNATSDPNDVGPVDLVILGIKAWQVVEAARAIKPMVGPNTVVLPLQNGVEAPQQLVAELGNGPVIGGLCRIVSFVVGPGHIRQAGFGSSIIVGELDNRSSQRVETIRERFVAAGINTSIAPDFDVALWTKFLFIAAFSGVAAVARQPAGVVRTQPETRQQLIRAMEEIQALARARQINLPSDAVAEGMANVDRLPGEGTSSMQRDIAEGKPSELESQNGAVVRMARELRIEVPTHEFIYGMLKPFEFKARGETP